MAHFRVRHMMVTWVEGFMAKTTINRHDFGVSWNERLDRGGVVVGDRAYVTVDLEALRETA